MAFEKKNFSRCGFNKLIYFWITNKMYISSQYWTGKYNKYKNEENKIHSHKYAKYISPESHTIGVYKCRVRLQLDETDNGNGTYLILCAQRRYGMHVYCYWYCVMIDDFSIM